MFKYLLKNDITDCPHCGMDLTQDNAILFHDHAICKTYKARLFMGYLVESANAKAITSLNDRQAIVVCASCKGMLMDLPEEQTVLDGFDGFSSDDHRRLVATVEGASRRFDASWQNALDDERWRFDARTKQLRTENPHCDLPPVYWELLACRVKACLEYVQALQEAIRKPNDEADRQTQVRLVIATGYLRVLRFCTQVGSSQHLEEL